MNYRERVKEWLDSAIVSEDLKTEIRSIDDEEELKDRFYRDLEFGTAGIRGIVGVGTNRMNEITVARATQGLANTIIKRGQTAMDRGVVIARDVRHMSREFSEIVVRVLAANGINAHIFNDIRPTPMLSYAVRYLGTISGIVITASHNPKQYNGYKVYWEEGSQILDDIANEIQEEIEKLKFEDIKILDYKSTVVSGFVHVIKSDLDISYYRKTLSKSINDDIDKDICVVYSPLNGTGNKPVRYVLAERGFTNINVVPEQENPDPDFETVGYPNPEDVNAFEYSLRLANEIDADLIFATDPDCDRVAMLAKKSEGDYYVFNGNQTGVLLTYYILNSLYERNIIPFNGAIVKSIVTGNLAKEIAESMGVTVFETLTGFKNICALPNLWDRTKEYKFIFGYEESIGYVYGDHVRDKDGVISSMMIVEMAAYYKKKGKNLIEVLEDIYKEFGYFKEDLTSIVLEGIEGQERISRMMEFFRKSEFSGFGGIKLEEKIDYIRGYNGVGPSNVLIYHLEDGSWFAVRPSGTEPKIKLYVYSKDENEEEAVRKVKDIKEDVENKLYSVN
ncbi:phospho-sugar mutase [Anaerosphaera multitolerans]|uniref:Phosphoglucomutase n=1 Tax=Anaerosphaera multitolerans TaxID=2487351 RepID=A0A437S753_9FIRM|nr:phospho-sugar mutase [Anaerosphaera multitolerans]RVU54824.1 phospho-sugar mutase [Anaerosphaera multitolerans]